MKITDAAPPTFPELSSTDDSLLPPDVGSSEPGKIVSIDHLEETGDVVLGSPDDHHVNEEFGDFLLDAVDWL